MTTMTTTRPAIFTATQFQPTQWATSEQKAKMANKLIAFLRADCPESKFSKDLYKMCSSVFGHIAHYNAAGFYATWFSTPERRVRFVRQALTRPCVGDPAWTWSDVEEALQDEFERNNDVYVGRNTELANASQLAREPAELARLQAKYAR